MSFTII